MRAPVPTRKRKIKIYISDAISIARFGFFSPKKYMPLFVRPREVKLVADEDGFFEHRKSTSQVVMGGEWDVRAIPWERCVRNYDYLIIRGVYKRIVQGESWEKTGLYERMERLIEENGGVFDGCKNRKDVEKRYESVERIIQSARESSALLSRGGMTNGFRELSGIDVSISRGGQILKSGGGGHRLAISKALNLPVIPVCINAVHPAAVTSGAWRRLLEQSRALSEERHNLACN